MAGATQSWQLLTLWLKTVIVLAREPISCRQLRFGLGGLGGRTAPTAAGTAAAVVLGKHAHLLMVKRPRTHAARR